MKSYFEYLTESGIDEILYHGTDNFWEIPEIHGLGFHAGTLKAARDRLKHNQIPVEHQIIKKLRMKLDNPIFLHRDYRFHNDLSKVAKELYKDHIIDKEDRDEFTRMYVKSVNFDNFRKLLIDKYGYDGIIYRNNIEDRGSNSYIAFLPNQITILDQNILEKEIK